MNIKAIMCDVDGTLLNRQGIVTPKTVEAIKKAREMGILFGLSTGRDVNSVKTLLKIWGIDGLVDVIVGTGGAEIYDYVLNIDQQSFPLEGELIHEIIKHFEDMDVNFAIPWEGILYAPKDDEHIAYLAKADRVPYKVADFNEFLKTPKPKVMIVCHKEDMPLVVERAKTFSNDKYKSSSLITGSILYEYMDPRVSKTYGLKQVMDMHGFSMDELCTFGDADNDYDMTLNAGVGVVMANGSDLTKSVADYITDDNNHDGIAQFINQYILK
ncbi:MAG: Cof-type HAD-IIB family hydrolase [Erysipelotrichaceae bacterium]|nr:Cof-type HAD-IIB family hydrolase [Erysipelotrichaceae bacterium]